MGLKEAIASIFRPKTSDPNSKEIVLNGGYISIIRFHYKNDSRVASAFHYEVRRPDYKTLPRELQYKVFDIRLTISGFNLKDSTDPLKEIVKKMQGKSIMDFK